MKTQYYTASTLDGFLADPDHSLDWLFQFGPLDETGYPAFIREVGALAMGSHSYEWILRHVVQPEGRPPQPWLYEQPSWVFTTRSLPVPPGADVRFVRGEVEPVHREMADAAGGKNLWLVGGGELVGQFYDRGLLDEIIVTVAPVTLGAGFPLLPRVIARPPLRLLSVQTYCEAFVELRYEVQRPAPQ